MKTSVGIALLIVGLVAGGLGSYMMSAGQLGSLSSQVSGLQSQVTTLQGDVSTLQTSLSDSQSEVSSLNQRLMALQVPLIAILSCPSTVLVGDHFTVTANVTGGVPGKIEHFGIHRDMSEADIVAISQTTGDTPQVFSEIVPAPNQTGPFVIRAHALVDGQEVWSDERTISVEQGSTFGLQVSASRIVISKLQTITYPVTLTLTVSSVNGFNSPVNLILDNVPSGVTATLGSYTVTPPADGEITTTLSIAVTIGAYPNTAFGVHTLDIVGTSGSTTQSDSLQVIVTNVPNAYTVTAIGLSFKPSTITVPIGATVLWVNTDPVTHSVTSSTGIWDSGDLPMGSSFVYLFNSTGTFTYHDKYDASMTGTVIVTP